MSDVSRILSRMTYDEQLAERVRAIVACEHALTEKRMFGGLAFLLGGHMAVAVSRQGGLLLRCDPARSEQLVAQPHVERMVMQGREMNGWLHVHPEALVDDESLRRWVAEGVTYVHTLPPK